MFKRNFFLFLCTFILLLTTISFVSSQPTTVVESFPKGYTIVEAQQPVLEKGENHTYYFFLYNTSDGKKIDNSSVNCSFYLSNARGNLVLEGISIYQPNGYWKREISGEYFNLTGYYSYGVNCQNDLGGALAGTFEVTESGLNITPGRSILLVGLLAILVFMSFLSLYGVFKIENPPGKFALYWTTHLLVLIVCFVGWQFGVEGLLDGTGIVQVFRILFYVLTVAVFPMLILSIAWVFYIHTMNDDIRRMMEKGMSPEEAYKKSINRRYF